MSTQLKEKINISVDNIETLTDVDLADLCNITEQAIKAGGGFGWLRVPTRDILIDYWTCLLYTSPSPRDATLSRMPSSA